MNTTTIRLDEALKQRIAFIAEREGKTPHAYMLDAIEQSVRQAEAAEEFRSLAQARWADILESGKTVPFESFRTYALARVRGETARKPTAKPLKR